MKNLKNILCVLRSYKMKVFLGKRLKVGKRCALCKYAGIEIGKNAFIRFGDRVSIRNFTSVCARSGSIELGNNVFLNQSVMIVAKEEIKIGDRTLIGPGVKIYDHDHVYDRNGVYNEYKTSSIVIGTDCWIGANAVILRGSKIGNHVVIGAGCIVKGVIEDNTVVVPQIENRCIEIKN